MGMYRPQKITNDDVDIINTVISLGRLLLPPVGTVMAYCNNTKHCSVPWTFQVFRWPREELILKTGERLNAIRQIEIRGIPKNCYGVSVMPLKDLRMCEVIDIPSGAPHFTEWLTLSPIYAKLSKKNKHFVKYMVAVEI